jgi:hypothetical protein
MTIAHTDHPLRHWDRACPACREEDRQLAPGEFNLDRMKQALAGPTWTMPKGLRGEDLDQYLRDCIDGLIEPDPPSHWESHQS